jgi:hypothetical protein
MAFPDEGVYYIMRVVGGVDVFANTIGQDFLLSGTGEMHQKVCFEDHSAIFSAHAVNSGGWNISKIMQTKMNEPALCPRSTV